MIKTTYPYWEELYIVWFNTLLVLLSFRSSFFPQLVWYNLVSKIPALLVTGWKLINELPIFLHICKAKWRVVQQINIVKEYAS